MARFAMNMQQKIQAAMKLSSLADENSYVDFTLKDIGKLLETELGLSQTPHETGIVTIMEGAGLSWKKPEPKNNLPMVQVWNAIKDLQAELDDLNRTVGRQAEAINLLSEEVAKLQLVNK